MTHRVLHLSHADRGGAAGAAYRLHRACVDAGWESRMLVADRSREDDPSVVAAGDTCRRDLLTRANAAPVRLHHRRDGRLFSPSLIHHGDDAVQCHAAAADIVACYWVAGGYLSPQLLAGLNKPVLWRLSDCWPFTGGCHYPGTCAAFERACGRCPALGSDRGHDLAWRSFGRKAAAWRSFRPVVVAPSRWIGDLARRSRLLGECRIEVVPTGVDLGIFFPEENRAEIRRRLGLPDDRRVIAFAALGADADRRKGGDLLHAALARLATQRSDLHLLVFGADAAAGEWPLPATVLPRLHDPAQLRECYNAADVVAVPSREDNLPNVALEALACGTPVAAFAVGGIPEAVREGAGGALARPDDPVDLAAAIARLADRGPELRRLARETVAAGFDRKHSDARFLDLLTGLVP